MKNITAIIIIITALFIASPAAAEEKIDCTMCHPEKTEGKQPHPAVSFGCDSCHSGVDASDIPHKFTGKKGLADEGNGLCFTCHDEDAFKKKNKHAALDMGCTTCHTPHNSANDNLLVEQQPSLCLMCHDEGMFNKKKRHAALDMGCTSCHSPHSSDFDKLTIEKVPELCYQCHEETLFYGPTIHSPVAEGGCMDCHTPHSADGESLTVEPVKDLCYSCHDKAAFASKKMIHSPVKEGMCTECHMPHISQNEKLLFRKGNMICRKCHEDVEKKPHTVAGFSGQSLGHPLRGRKDYARPGKIHSCQSCHMPHQSENPYLFRYKGNSAFDLCGYCHKY